jgi:FdhE protein
MVHVDALTHLARTDATAAPLARLQAVALRAAEDSGWLKGVPPLTVHSDTAPLLHDAALTVVGEAQRTLLVQLARAHGAARPNDGRQLGAFFNERAFDPLALLAASIQDDGAVIASLAQRADTDAAVLAVVAQVAALPLLLACGSRAAEAVQSVVWPHGYCPVCAAYPTLAELRGLARDRVLRCGRCGTGWPFEHVRCPFCDSQDQRAQGYFAAESERESRRAVTCDACRGYLKTVATLGPLTIAQVLLRDLETLELDVSAMDQEYQRPDGLGWPLHVTLRAAPAGRGGWLTGW